jgi:tRNA pseudouridine55 synthase
MKILKQTSDYIAVYKDEGKTPLEAIRALQDELPELADEKLAYAGRLDPMAEGVLIILRGEACKARDTYLGLDKTYEFEVLFGVTSDTQDILGLVEAGNVPALQDIDQDRFTQRIQNALEHKQGKLEMSYPAFSSKTVDGKPLFLWALEDRLDEITIPTRSVEIYEITLESITRYSLGELIEQVPNRIAQVSPVQEESKALGADFRRKEVLQHWHKLEELHGNSPVVVAKITAQVSSGTYVRTLARLLGEEMGSGAIAWRIRRTQIGEVSVLD